MFVITERSGTTHGSWSLKLLLDGYNDGRPREAQLRRVHSYYVMQRDRENGYQKRYKDCFLEKVDGARPVDHMYD